MLMSKACFLPLEVTNSTLCPPGSKNSGEAGGTGVVRPVLRPSTNTREKGEVFAISIPMPGLAQDPRCAPLGASRRASGRGAVRAAPFVAGRSLEPELLAFSAMAAAIASVRAAGFIASGVPDGR